MPEVLDRNQKPLQLVGDFKAGMLALEQPHRETKAQAHKNRRQVVMSLAEYQVVSHLNRKETPNPAMSDRSLHAIDM